MGKKKKRAIKKTMRQQPAQGTQQNTFKGVNRD